MDTDLQILFFCSLVVITEIFFPLARAVVGRVMSREGTYVTFVGIDTVLLKLIFLVTLTSGDIVFG